jgi:hypothetical protein
MGTVDFSDWAVPDLELALGGKKYVISPPSVKQVQHILALTVRAEINLGLATGPLPQDLQDVLVSLGDTKLGVVTMGQAVYDQLVEDGYPPITIDRMAYYALFFWSRGKGRADALATVLWAPRDTEEPDAPGEAVGR